MQSLIAVLMFLVGFLVGLLFGFGVRKRRDRSPRDYALGLGSTSVSGRESAIIYVKPKVAFEPRVLLLPPNIACDFFLEGVTVDDAEVLCSAGAVPAAAFSQGKGIPLVRRVIASPSSTIKVRVSNIYGMSRDFQGCLVGPAVGRP